MRYPGADRNAVDGVTLDIAGGSFTVLLGPSGCGKSTLLRTVNALVKPQSGRVTIDGSDVAAADGTQLRRGIGYVIQAIGLFSHMTVGENIAVVPSLLHWDRARTAERVDELLGLTGLAPDRYRNRYPRELSGGEQQRVGVARAIAAEPRVLLMDEPFGAVDAILRADLQDEMLRIVQSLKTTVVFVTHDVDEALRLADRIVVMREGRVEQYDTPLDILTKPSTRFVAQLLGTDDTLRRLSLMRAADAAVASESTSAETIDAGASLRDALNRLLGGVTRLSVVRDGAPIGSLGLEEIRKALQ
ncbi:MAG TPA: ABC transporter ATP-binding protein [Candidatus Baltobacteraceae bacterium]|nr:ABC transporter ATP-binding protein [Candidatus Baltobacteraceae bacterium]